jgi:hypothetical protein
MPPPLPSLMGLSTTAAITRPEAMESKMVVYTIVELMRLTRVELCDLAAKITNRLPDHPQTSPAYANAREMLRNIRHLLARRNLDPE